jgi:hypothetical protein
LATRWLSERGAWEKIDGAKPGPLSPEFQTSLNGYLTVNRALKLIPLLAGKEFRISQSGVVEVAGTKATAIKIEFKSPRSPVTFFLDNTKSLVIKTMGQDVTRSNRRVLVEDYLSDHKAFAGVVLPSKVVTFFDGKKYREIRVIDFRPLTKEERTDPKIWEP